MENTAQCLLQEPFSGNFADRISIIVVTRLIIDQNRCNWGAHLPSIVFFVAENCGKSLGPMSEVDESRLLSTSCADLLL